MYSATASSRIHAALLKRATWFCAERWEQTKYISVKKGIIQNFLSKLEPTFSSPFAYQSSNVGPWIPAAQYIF